MEQHHLRRPRRTAALFLTALTALGLAVAPPAGAVEDVISGRIAGADRFLTAAAIADAAFPTGSDTVLIASGRKFPDALAGAALGLPILLTEQDSLPSATAAAIDDLNASNAIILGGTGSVSPAVESEVATHAATSRLAGNDRYETAADIATSVGAANVGVIDAMKTAIIATGNGFADALAGGPLATGGPKTLPVLLVNDSTPEATANALDDLGIQQVVILGGSAAVSPAVQTQLEILTGNDAIRLAGNNRYGTAVAIAEFALDKLAFPGDATLLASGADFADALAGGPLGGVRQAPLLLTDPVQLPDESGAFFVAHADTIETVDALGGTAAVSQSALETAEHDAETPPVTGANEQLAVAPKTRADQANGSTREYTVSGLGTTVIDIALMPCNLVITQSNGDTAFSNTNLNNIADGGADSPTDPVDEADTPAYISSTNGDPSPPDANHDVINDDYADDVAPTAGTVTFVVTGPSGATAAACVIPVVFEDASNDDALTTPTQNPVVPTERFGTGGATTFSPSAFGGTTFNVDVDTSPDANNRFTGCKIVVDNADLGEQTDPRACNTFVYDDNDSFQLNGVATTLAVFEAILTSGDDVRGTYKANPADAGIFDLYHDEAPEPPAINDGSTASPNPETTPNSVTIHFAESSRTTVDSYRLYRAVKPAPVAPSTTSTCPALPGELPPRLQTFAGTAYTQVTGTRATWTDAHQTDTPDPRITPEVTDETLQPGVTYCYSIVSVDDGDEGPPSTLVEASVEDTTGPILVTTVGPTAAQTTPPRALQPGDVHTFTFNEPMNQSSLVGASYTVSGSTTTGTTSATITCGSGGNVCQLDSTNNKVITIRIGAAAVSATPPQYDLTITAISGFNDAAGNPIAAFSASTVLDPTIERVNPVA